jgi:endonuclease/exonuclease/phosphatase family metal-dependent hydrolase
MGKYTQKIIDLLSREKPDIIALQEVIQDEGGNNNTAEFIANALGYHWVFSPVTSFRHEGREVDWGEAVLSRYDIEKSEVLELSTDPRHIGLLATIKIHEKKLHVVSTHLIHTHQTESVYQQEEARSLIRLVPKNRTVVMGDFNALPDSKSIAIMRETFNQADPANAPTWCVYPDGCATCKLGAVSKRLDYIFTTSDLQESDYHVIQSDGSDHLPIEITLAI